jgi:hypothetical protein
VALLDLQVKEEHRDLEVCRDLMEVQDLKEHKESVDKKVLKDLKAVKGTLVDQDLQGSKA